MQPKRRLQLRRNYAALVQHLRQVWRITEIDDGRALWRVGRAEHDAATGKNLRIGIWNICKGAGTHLFEHDLRAMLYESDVLLLQEALLSQHALRIFSPAGFEAIHATSYCRGDGLHDGVLTLSRFRLTESRRILCRWSEPVFRTPKVALVNFIHLDEGRAPLMLINLHSTLMRSPMRAEAEMLHLLGRLPPHDGPILLAGDFNTFTTRYLRCVQRQLATIGLRHVSIPNDPRTRLQALDQVFVRGLHVVHAEVAIRYRNSDHFPLRLELRRE